MVHTITHDMDHKIRLALSYDDVLLEPRYSRIKSRADVDLSVKLTPNIVLKLPLISSNMSDVTGVDMAITLGKLGGLGVLPRFMPLESQIKMITQVKKAGVLTAASIGIKDDFLERATTLINSGADLLFLDVAHGHMSQAILATKTLKDKFGPQICLISGNIATYDGAKALFEAGADVVKVGVGPGSICTTRIETGSGVPQITALLEASKAARQYQKTIICDGGIKNSGDIIKGLAAGASAVMIGNQFAATDRSPGKVITINDKKFKRYNASTCLTEKKNHLQQNHQELSSDYLKQIEGIESFVPYKGSLEKIVEQMSANIRSGLSYSGAENIEILWQNAQFVRITAQGLRESNPHDVLLPNLLLQTP